MSGGSRLLDRPVKWVLDWMIRRRLYVPGSPFRRLMVRYYACRDTRDHIWYFSTPQDITETEVNAFNDWWEREA